MRISDWSSDVCSSDLLRQSVGLLRRLQGPLRHCVQAARRRRLSRPSRQRKIWCTMMHDPIADWLFHPLPADSFLADFWAKEHHVVRRDDPGYFADLFSAKRSEEHTSELQSLMRISYAVFRLKKKHQRHNNTKK